VNAEAVEAMLGRIRHKLIASGEREIVSRQIGELLMDELKEIDQVAYVRFASVYRSFQDINAFSETVRHLQSEPSADSRRKQLRLIPDPETPETAAPDKRGSRKPSKP
jgi:transcriptional repressor NrdR